MKQRIYLDYSATTPLRPEARQAMQPFLDDEFGNPSSVHAAGRAARMAVEESRRRLRDSLGGPKGEIVFTGSGSESDNLAILGFARRAPGGCIVRSAIEHKAVLESTRALREGGYDVREAPVDSSGTVIVEALADLLPGDGRPTLVSVMWANNETGVIQPVARIAALCRERGVLFHSDAVQAFGKIPLDLDSIPVDLLSLSAHKIGGPKGVGTLLVRGVIALEPLVYGGGQEAGLRSGTQNVAAIAGFAEAAAVASAELAAVAPAWRTLRDRLQDGLTRALPHLIVNGGDAAERLPHVLNVSVPGVDIEGLLTALDLEGIQVSSGSACTTGSVEPSHVLRAMGRQGDAARNTIRLSLGWRTEDAEIERVVGTFPTVVERIRELSPSTRGRRDFSSSEV
jgi:cysteine desulfurase